MTGITVVIPVYNVQDYLDDCLSSLEAQDCRDFEAICVNDGSTDGSRAILGAWEGRVPWLRVIDQENGGLSRARNVGMRASRGDYVCFLDSDDRLLPQAVSTILKGFGDGSDVLVFGGLTLPRDATTSFYERSMSPRDKVFEGPDADLLFAPDARPYAVRTSLSASFMRERDVYFDEEIGYGEDQPFQFRAYLRSSRTRLISDRIYEYRIVRSGSLMSDARGDQVQMLLNHVRIADFCLREFEAVGMLDTYAGPLFDWVVSLVANDALKMGGADCAEVMRSLGEMLARHVDGDEVAGLTLHPSTRAVVEASMGHSRYGAVERTRLFVPLHAHLYGRRSLLRELTGRSEGI